MKKVAILGAGESGTGAAVLAQQSGWDVWVSDRGTIAAPYRQELDHCRIQWEQNRHTRERIFAADVVVKSPGIPDQIPLIQDLLAAGIPVISEIEFAFRHTTKATVIGITGSNGKTTTTKLLYHLLDTAGYSVNIGGNIGKSYARLVAQQARPYYVLEISSFQLDGTVDFHPQIAILLNITPDHLDRYDYQMEKYIRSKLRIAKNLAQPDCLIYNGDDANISAQLAGRERPFATIAIQGDPFDGQYLEVGPYRFDWTKCGLKGAHNRFNARCAIEAALRLGVEPAVIQTGLESFVNAPHRLEWVARIAGVDYLNDSKATNVDATYFALAAQDQTVVWILGGTDKGNDYAPLFELAEQKVKAIVCLGLDNRKIRTAFAERVATIVETQSAEAAVHRARELANPGEVVLLSPACASFDLFAHYEDRGDQFKRAVLNLRDQPGP